MDTPRSGESGNSVVIPYAPREAFMGFHGRVQKQAVVVTHRRAGKTIAIANDGMKRALEIKRADPPGRIAWVFPTRVRAKDIAWERLKHYGLSVPGARALESELSVEFPNKARFTLYGADNTRAVGLWLDGVYYDEADEIPVMTVTEISPTLADYGGFTVFAGYLRGRHNLFKRWEKVKDDAGVFSMFLRASESGIYSDEVLAEQRKEMGESAYLMQWELDINQSMDGAILGKQMDAVRRENRITRVAWDVGVPVDFFFDIGHALHGDDWSVWAVQFSGRDILCQKYYARTGEVPAHYAGMCLGTAERAGCTMGTVYLPHDGGHKDRHGKSAEDDLRAAGVGRVVVVPRTPAVWDSIDKLRMLMPRMVIDGQRCGETWRLGDTEMPSGIDCLDYYSKKEDATTGVIQDVPVHDQYSHGVDALRTLAEAERQGMIAGTSGVARESRSGRGPRLALRGNNLRNWLEVRRALR